MARNTRNEVARVLQKLLRRLQGTGLGPEEMRRLTRKADALVRGLNTKARKGKKLDQLVARLLVEFVSLP